MYDPESSEAVSIKNSENLKCLPSRIHFYFPNIKAFEVENCSLVHIDRQDMRELGNFC